MFDVMSLRKWVKVDRKRYVSACAEIDKEHGCFECGVGDNDNDLETAKWEKFSWDINFKGWWRKDKSMIAKMIESLRWNVVEIASPKSFLEEQFRIFKERLREFMKDDEIEKI